MLDPKTEKQLSKFLSLVLRHKPQTLGLELDAQGWTSVALLLEKLRERAYPDLSLADLQALVAHNAKQRFAFSEDGLQIRAQQGHSLSVDLGYEAQTPPALLYHGTSRDYLPAILAEGLKKQQRHQVHLSADIETARQVGMRHGPVVILEVKAQAMQAEGALFYRSGNGVWLVEEVPPQYLKIWEG